MDPATNDVLSQLFAALPFSPQTRALILALLPPLYALLLVARRFTPPDSAIGKIIRLPLVGWKHPDEVTPPQDGKPPAEAGSAPAISVGSAVSKAPILLVLLGSLMFAQPARATDFGGCFDAGKTICAGPSATLTLVGLDLKQGTFATGIIPGVGYGVTFFSDKWYVTGLAFYANLSTTSAGTSGLFSMIGSFANYVRFGVGETIIGAGLGNGFQHNLTLLLGVGADFGRT